jgi:hypothetical protein
MAGTVSPQTNWDDLYPEHPVNELLSQKAGAQSPFGDDLTLPLPIDAIHYRHPTRAERPHLAGE